jgi:ABC-type uncharacterized transport system substrate-binding protein
MLVRMKTYLVRLILAALALTVVGSSAFAHPHVWVTMRSELVYAPDGKVTGIRHAWTFDDMFSAFAIQGIEAKKRGEFTREELHPLAQTNVESLKDFDYFTVFKVNGKQVSLTDPPAGYYLEYQDQILTLHFTLPLQTPVQARDLQVEIFDPSYFVDFSFEQKNAVSLVAAPQGCKVSVVRPEEMDADTAAKLFQLAPDQKLDPSQFLGSQFANKIVVRCP